MRQQRLCAASVDGHDWPQPTADGGGFGKCRKCGLVVLPPDDGPGTGERQPAEQVA